MRFGEPCFSNTIIIINLTFLDLIDSLSRSVCVFSFHEKWKTDFRYTSASSRANWRILFCFLLSSFDCEFSGAYLFIAFIHLLLFTMSHSFLTSWSMVFVGRARFSFSIIASFCCCYFGVIVRCTQHWSDQSTWKQTPTAAAATMFNVVFDTDSSYVNGFSFTFSVRPNTQHTLRPLTSFFLLHLSAAGSLSHTLSLLCVQLNLIYIEWKFSKLNR